ncbi:MAG: class I SAM-dependent methyltransferase [Pikeienuella sp.]|uniref:class I SAM-dependent methyltransferase n=1 Tax=Pikeienuella sp. TaxID=2831957 RepID=UPI00391A4F48
MQSDPTAELKAILRDFVADRDVLDVGSVNHFFKGANWSRGWIFDFLLSEARAVRGIDIAKRQVRAARKAGYDIRVADAELYRAERRFEVVLASDLIEHLSNPGMFLACARANLEPGGRLVLVTPNGYCLREIYMVVKGWTNDPDVHWQHVCYFTPRTLTALAARAGFALEEIRYANIHYKQVSPLQRVLLWVNRRFCRIFPRFSQTMILVFRMQGEAGEGAAPGECAALSSENDNLPIDRAPALAYPGSGRVVGQGRAAAGSEKSP